MTPLIREIASIDEELALACIWFDIGSLQRFEFAWSDLLGLNLPFGRCAIVGRDRKSDKFLVVAEQEEENTILLTAWALLVDRYTRTPMFAVVTQEGGCQIANVDGEDEITKEHAAPIVGILAEFLHRIDPQGHRATAKPNSLTNKRRAEKGKPPLVYDWYTVKIEPPQKRSEPRGGTHSSPRQHERRGHWRTLPGGNRVWVRNCVVGNAAMGTVFKDYKA